MKNTAKLIKAEVFTDAANVYAVLDGASVPQLLPKLDECRPEFACLYRGELKPDLVEVAPYLVRLEAEAEFTDWVISEGWGNHWGIYATSDADFRDMCRHFRRLLTVYSEDGKPLLFRYYDPRVLREYLPTCDPGELSEFFGPVSTYLLEDEDPTKLLSFKARVAIPNKRELLGV